MARSEEKDTVGCGVGGVSVGGVGSREGSFFGVSESRGPKSHQYDQCKKNKKKKDARMIIRFAGTLVGLTALSG